MVAFEESEKIEAKRTSEESGKSYTGKTADGLDAWRTVVDLTELANANAEARGSINNIKEKRLEIFIRFL